MIHDAIRFPAVAQNQLPTFKQNMRGFLERQPVDVIFRRNQGIFSEFLGRNRDSKTQSNVSPRISYIHVVIAAQRINRRSGRQRAKLFEDF